MAPEYVVVLLVVSVLSILAMVAIVKGDQNARECVNALITLVKPKDKN